MDDFKYFGVNLIIYIQNKCIEKKIIGDWDKIKFTNLKNKEQK